MINSILPFHRSIAFIEFAFEESTMTSPPLNVINYNARVLFQFAFVFPRFPSFVSFFFNFPPLLPPKMRKWSLKSSLDEQTYNSLVSKFHRANERERERERRRGRSKFKIFRIFGRLPRRREGEGRVKKEEKEEKENEN